MTFSLDPKTLATVHSALKGTLDPRNNIPVCGMFRLAAGDGKLAVTATDCDIETVLTVDCDAELAPVCVPPYLLEASGGLKSASVDIEIDDQQAVFKSGRARFAAPILPGIDFPVFAPRFDSSFAIAGSALAGLFHATRDAVEAPGGHRYYLEGVYLETGEGRLHAVATNGHRLHTTSVEAPDGARLAPGEGIIVPAKACVEIIRLAGEAAEQPVTVEISRNMIAVSAGAERITSKLIEGTFPDWRRVLPQETKISAAADVSELLAAIDRVMKIQSVNEIKMKAKERAGRIKLEADGDYLVVSSGDRGDNQARDGVPAEFAGDWGYHGASARYLRATLAAMAERKGDTVIIDSGDMSSPMRIESPTDEDFLAVVMPMRV
jgi:DNA polymerase-3 subunit beta